MDILSKQHVKEQAAHQVFKEKTNVYFPRQLFIFLQTRILTQFNAWGIPSKCLASSVGWSGYIHIYIHIQCSIQRAQAQHTHKNDSIHWKHVALTIPTQLVMIPTFFGNNTWKNKLPIMYTMHAELYLNSMPPVWVGLGIYLYKIQHNPFHN